MLLIPCEEVRYCEKKNHPQQKNFLVKFIELILFWDIKMVIYLTLSLI